MKNYHPLAYRRNLYYCTWCDFSDFKKRPAHYLQRATHSYPILVRDNDEKNNFAILSAKVYARMTALLYLTACINHAIQPSESVHSFNEIITHFQLDFTPKSDAYTRQFSDEAFQDLVRIFDENIHDEDTSRMTIRHIVRTVEKFPLPALPEEDFLDDDTAPISELDSIYFDTEEDFNKLYPNIKEDASQPVSEKPTEKAMQRPEHLDNLLNETLSSLRLRDHARVRGDNLIIFNTAGNSVLIDRIFPLEDHNLYLLFMSDEEPFE